jgi:hypothetical protein
MVSAEPVLPGVYRRQDGGFVVRGSAKDPRTGKLTQVFRVLEDETEDGDGVADTGAGSDPRRRSGSDRGMLASLSRIRRAAHGGEDPKR